MSGLFKRGLKVVDMLSCKLLNSAARILRNQVVFQSNNTRN